jgi:hypothetical protein
MDPDQPKSTTGLANQLASAAGSTSRRRSLIFAPWNWRVRVKWVGFGPMDKALPGTLTTTQMGKSVPTSTPVRVLQTFDLPKMKVRVSWMGLRSLNHIGGWFFGILVVLLGVFAFTRFASMNNGERTFDVERIDPAGLIVYEMGLGDDMIRMTHSKLDIGHSKDIFDDDLETLVRGREANPFILDFEFSQPQAVNGLVMDFGRMDFVIRVQVYGTESRSPVLYESEYRQQPPIPHVEIDFFGGPVQVKRIYIEIEQLNPPDEVHIHIREVLFKE